nr:hypothetical protein [Mycobacterium marinum]
MRALGTIGTGVAVEPAAVAGGAAGPGVDARPAAAPVSPVTDPLGRALSLIPI